MKSNGDIISKYAYLRCVDHQDMQKESTSHKKKEMTMKN